MPDKISDESIHAIRILFLQRLADTNNDLIEMLSNVAIQIENQNHNALLALYVEFEERIRRMHTILTVFRKCLEG